MQFQQFDVTTNPTAANVPKPTGAGAASDLLRQLLDVQREQLDLMKAHQAHLTAMAEAQGKRRSWFDRWQEDFGHLPDSCRRAMPILERAYLNMISNLVDEVRQTDLDGFESDFALRDFLDRFGLPLVHLGGILQAVGPLSEVNPPSETT